MARRRASSIRADSANSEDIATPRNRWHAYRNVGTVAARLLVFAIPGAGLERMFAAFDATSKRTGQMLAIDTLVAIAEQYGVVIHPPAG